MTKKGYYGQWGGAFIPEVLHETFRQLNGAFEQAQADAAFWAAYESVVTTYSGRPTPLTFAENLTRHCGGARIYVRHDLAELDLDPAAAGFAVVVHGHTHRPEIVRRGGVLYVNPGSPARPRGGSACRSAWCRRRRSGRSPAPSRARRSSWRRSTCRRSRNPRRCLREGGRHYYSGKGSSTG